VPLGLGEVWIGFEAVERLGIWRAWSTVRNSAAQHGTTRSTLEGAPESEVSSHSGGSPRSSLSPLASHLSPLTSHLSPLTSRSSVKRRPRPSVTPQNVPLLFSPLFPPYSQLLGAAPRTNLLRCSFEIPQHTMVHPRTIILKSLADFHGGGDGGRRKQNCPA
jgi:hypothetical protein